MMLVQGLHKVIGETTILQDIDLDVTEGEIVAIVEPATTGLHALFQMLIGQMTPTSGLIEVNGNTPENKRDYVSSLGILFEEDTLYPHMTVVDNLRFVAKLFHVDSHEIDRILAEVGLSDRARTPVSRLSSPLSRRVALGRALLHDPKTLVLFDPFARCDEPTILLITKLLTKQATQSKSIIILSPGMDHLQFCDRIYMLRHGQLNPVNTNEAEIEQIPLRIPVQLDGKVTLVNPADILYITTQDRQVILYTDNEQFVSNFSLSELEERLSHSGFFRAHRAYLVNLQRVKDIVSYTRDSFNLRLNDAAETQIPLSKNAATRLKKLFDY